MAPDATWWTAGITGAIGAVIALVIWAVYGAPRLDMSTDSAIVANPTRRLLVPFEAIERIEVENLLVFVLRDGERVRVWSVQAANVSLIFNRESHVDRVAAEVDAWIQDHIDGNSADRLVEQPAFLWSRVVAVVIVSSALAIALWSVV